MDGCHPDISPKRPSGKRDHTFGRFVGHSEAIRVDALNRQAQTVHSTAQGRSETGDTSAVRRHRILPPFVAQEQKKSSNFLRVLAY
jgi:hypothetical protein